MKKIKPEKIFTIVALIFGILFIFLTPPFQSPDENSHFKKAYLVSKGKLYPIVENKKAGNYLPKKMLEYINEKLGYIGDREKKYNYNEAFADQYDYMNHDDVVFNSYSTASTPFISYIPPAIGIVISKIVGTKGVSVSYMLYFARICSLIFSIFIIYHAIKITPVLKKTMTTVALMPMSIFLMGMITYDNMIISISLFTVAYILRLIYDDSIKRIDNKNIFILILLGFILFNYKTLYLSLFILLLFIPNEKFGSLKSKIIKFIIIGVFILLLTALIKLPLLFLAPTDDSAAKLTSLQSNYVKNNFGTYLIVLFKNIFSQKTYQMTSMVGTFGLLDTYLPIPIIYFYLFLLVYMGLCENRDDKYKIKLSMKSALLFAIILSVFTIYTAMYISWTPQVFGKIGTKEITGVQGRYFIPLLFPALLLLSNNKLGKKFKMLKEYYIIGIVITLMISSLTLLLRFWV